MGSRSNVLADPDNRVCINVDGATPLEPAMAPQNFTDSTATDFAEFDCEGDICTVANPGKKLSILTRFRSVILS
ncbi:hypothetical protein [Kitasatospora sp. NPDC002040]|uniref:hypothetical protein n=1 Tax=Kitasatospora sp. NPDC002040 TaxID=3154661 RepID=UPI00333418CE